MAKPTQTTLGAYTAHSVRGGHVITKGEDQVVCYLRPSDLKIRCLQARLADLVEGDAIRAERRELRLAQVRAYLAVRAARPARIEPQLSLGF